MPDESDVRERAAALWLEYAWLALIVAATWIAYSPALGGGFIWDDNTYVRDNGLLNSADGLRKIWLQPTATPQYHPLVFTTFWIEQHLWGLDPFGYHVVNLALHSLDTVLLWLLLHRLAVPGAVLAAGIFALHPVHVESVAWITERKDVLSTLFYLLTVLAWSRFVDSRSWRAYLAVTLLLLCTLLSKSVLCTLPLALLLLEWWKRPAGLRRQLPWILPLLVISGGFALLNLWREQLHGNPASGWSLAERLIIAGDALWFYAGKLLWPTSLTAIYPPWVPDAGSLISYAGAVGAMALLFLLWRMRPQWGVGAWMGVVFFVLTLAPLLGFVDNNFMRLAMVADHFQYVASIGLIVLFAAVLTAALGEWSAGQSAVSAALLMLLAVLTWHQAKVYRDAETFWRDNIRKNPRSWMAYNSLAGALVNQGRLDEAMQSYAAAVEIKPDYPEAYNRWGIVLYRKGELDAAMRQYKRALRLDPNLAEVHNNAGTILFRQGKVDEAATHFATAVSIDPEYAAAHAHLGMAVASQGRTDEAMEHFRTALRLRPDYEEARKGLDRAVAVQR